ncbi:MAG TPA: GNAT family N-acetyltransferase [Anaerolineae bacterium]
MQPWVIEYGTLWTLETGDGLPPMCPARVEVGFEEVGAGDIDDLAVAMNLPSSEAIRQRLQGNRRCFILKVGDRIATYGWVTYGVEVVGELERTFYLHDDEAYIWDCGTVPAWRGQRCYSALLSHLIYRLHHEGIPRIWIGASRQNQPSIQGIANAGFQRVIDLTYRRFTFLTFIRFQEAPTALPSLVSAAYRILLDDHERRVGPLAIGFKQ